MSGANLIAQMLPMLILGAIYAAVVYVIARKRRINPWGWTIASLIPGIGLLVAGVFWVVTLFSVLDRLNALEDGQTGSTFN